MSVRTNRRSRAAVRVLAVAGLFLAVPCLPARADKLDKEGKKWLDEVRAIILPDEEKILRDLGDKADREEFQKIFWARRDPNTETPENEFQAEFSKLRADADTKFKIPGRPGSQTDCGRVYILLGAPDAVAQGDPTGDSPGARVPETWTYRDRPKMKFQGGQVQIGFNDACELPQGARLGEQLNHIAESYVVSPNLTYQLTGGHLKKLADMLPKPSPVLTLLKTPRQDFPVATHTTLYLRAPDGGTYLAGLLRADPGAVAVQEAGGKKTAKVLVAVEAKDEAGHTFVSEREAMADVASDGAAVVSYGMAVKPGNYTLKVGLLDAAGGKGSVATETVKMPDLTAGELTVSPVLVLRDIKEMPPSTDDAYASFQLGPMRFFPRFGNVFSAQDAVTLLAFIYNPKVDEASGKPSTTSSFTILKDGKAVARSEDQTYDTQGAGPSVGPVPLSKYGTGKYLVQFKVRDNVAKKDLTQETSFEVK